jgi:hypothetical protein
VAETNWQRLGSPAHAIPRPHEPLDTEFSSIYEDEPASYISKDLYHRLPPRFQVPATIKLKHSSSACKTHGSSDMAYSDRDRQKIELDKRRFEIMGYGVFGVPLTIDDMSDPGQPSSAGQYAESASRPDTQERACDLPSIDAAVPMPEVICPQAGALLRN